MSMLDPALIRIDKARLHNARVHDAPRLTRALDQVTPASIGLRPRATLIVRRLALRTPLSRIGPADRFVAGLRDDLRARLVSARRGQGSDQDDLLFEDDVALEAAIIVAWLDGGPAPSWTHAIGAGAPLARWRRHILSDLQLLSRIIARLVDLTIAERWLDHFDPAELRTITARLLETYGAAMSIKSTDFRNEVATIVETPANKTAGSGCSKTIAEFIPSEARSIIRPDVRLLVAVALTIVRRPTMIALPTFAQALAQLLNKTPQNVVLHQQMKALNSASPRKRPIPERKTPDARPTEQKSRKTPRARGADHPVPDAPSPPEIITAEPPAPTNIDRRTITTDYGGLFFVLNAFLSLRLYGDFTRPGDGLKGLSPFELMHMLATRWFGASFKTDPIAALLITLAGLEPGDRPGRLFEPPQWAVPDDWLLPWSGVKRPGFPLTDHRTPTRQRWINNLSRYLAARLKRALDTPDAVAITCTQPARIVIDGDRINIHFPLADHPIALRFAGLDRDPGWVPAAAHFIEFSFT
jgi:hypothetical protein